MRAPTRNRLKTYTLLPQKIAALCSKTWRAEDELPVDFRSEGFTKPDSTRTHVDGQKVGMSYTWVQEALRKEEITCQSLTLELIVERATENVPYLKSVGLSVLHLEDEFSVEDFRNLIGVDSAKANAGRSTALDTWFQRYAPSKGKLFSSKREATIFFELYRQYTTVTRYRTRCEARKMKLEFLNVVPRTLGVRNRHWGVVCRLSFLSINHKIRHIYHGYVSGVQENVLYWQFEQKSKEASDTIVIMTEKGAPNASSAIKGKLLTVSEGPAYSIISEEVEFTAE